MYLKNLQLANFKNFDEADIELSSNINCFIGNNGVGKTNVLDAIYYLSFCKSYFNQPDAFTTKHHKAFFTIRGQYNSSSTSREEILCQYDATKKKKRFKRNGKTYPKLAEHIGLIPLVMISPYDRDLINNHSEIRRKYLDSVISQFNKAYLYALIRYNKALSQRNALLKSFAEGQYYEAALIEIWNKELSQYGQEIYDIRQSFIADFLPIFQKYFAWISQGKETVSIAYHSSLQENNMEQLLQNNITKDRAVRYTSNGIHKDDLGFFMADYPIKKYGSQGQQKSFVIAIKMAQFEYMREITKTTPILLLDDIFDKLDHQRVAQIIELVNTDAFGQVFITDTQAERIDTLFKDTIDHKTFRISNNSII